MSEKRKKYTPAEKAKIALEAIKGELTLAQIVSCHNRRVSACNGARINLSRARKQAEF